MKFKLVSDDKREIRPNWEHIKIYVSRYKPHTSFDLEVVRRVAKKSDPMRKYYFAEVMPKFIKKLGYEKDETLLVHHQLKIRHFENDPKYEVEQDRRGIWRNVPSVFGNKSKMPVPDKKKFVDWVIRKAAQAGVYINDPA